MAENLILHAIDNRLVLEVKYTAGVRHVEPYCYGIGSQNQRLLRCYQISGASVSGEWESWKLFRQERIQAIEVLDRCFIGQRKDYNPDDPAMTRGIIKRIKR